MSENELQKNNPLFIVGSRITIEDVTALLNIHDKVYGDEDGIKNFSSFDEYANASLKILNENKHIFTVD